MELRYSYFIFCFNFHFTFAENSPGMCAIAPNLFMCVINPKLLHGWHWTLSFIAGLAVKFLHIQTQYLAAFKLLKLRHIFGFPYLTKTWADAHQIFTPQPQRNLFFVKTEHGKSYSHRSKRLLRPSNRAFNVSPPLCLPLNHILKGHIQVFLEHFQEWWLHPLLPCSSLFQYSTILSGKKKKWILMPSLNLSLDN